MITSSAMMNVGPTTTLYVTPATTSTLATAARATTKMAAMSGGRVRRRDHERSIIAAASRHAPSSATRPTRSCWLTCWRWGSGACRSRRAGRDSPDRNRFGAQACLGAHVDLVELLVGEAVGSHQLAQVGAGDRQQEPYRNADDADVLQRKGGVRVDGDRPARADGDEPDRDQGSPDEGRDRAPRVEPFPEEGEQDGRQVGGRRDHERDAGDQRGRVGRGADTRREPDGDDADEPRGDARDEDLLAFAHMAVEDVRAD